MSCPPAQLNFLNFDELLEAWLVVELSEVRQWSKTREVVTRYIVKFVKTSSSCSQLGRIFRR